MNPRLRHLQRFAGALTLASASAFAPSAFAMPAGPAGALYGMGAGPLMGRMLPGMLDRVNATPEQRSQIQKILEANSAEREAQLEATRALQQQAMALFTQPTVDAKAVEELRQKQMALHDAASKRMTVAMIEISRVLTLEQRRQMADDASHRREMRQRHYRESQGAEAAKR
jgi:Spy/CpxP family protein refolding chaperone